MLTTSQVKILVPGQHDMVRLVGARDELLKLIESAFDAEILVRGNEIVISGEARETERVSHLFQELITLLDQGHVLTKDAVDRSIDIIKADSRGKPSQVLGDVVVVTHSGKPIRPKTSGQKRYIDAIR